MTDFYFGTPYIVNDRFVIDSYNKAKITENTKLEILHIEEKINFLSISAIIVFVFEIRLYAHFLWIVKQKSYKIEFSLKRKPQIVTSKTM